MFPIIDRLHDEQRAAATFTGAPLRIVAGAGTGKTTTLTSRVAWLVSEGTPAERILLLTFTRRAARDMVARTRNLLAEAGTGRLGMATSAARAQVVGGTFHSIAHRTLRRHATALGLPEGFSVLDASDAADVVDLVRQEQGAATGGQRFPRKATLLDLYSRSVNTQRPLSDVIDEVAPWCADRVEAIAAICKGYVARKRALGLLDFDDLLLYWRAAATDDRLGRTLAGEVDHVCVDEYQDVNALQVDVLRALRRDDDRLTVVGDDAQAVYGFRGASPRHLLDAPDVFPRMVTIVLGANHRSTQPILDVANAVGADAPEGFTARLRAVGGVEGDPAGGGPRPRLVRCADEDAQVDAVCEQILAAREEGVALRRQAVLVRAGHRSELLEIELSRRRIPYVKYGGLRYLEAAHVKDLVCVFRLADNPRDELAWFRILQLLEGVGPVHAHRATAALGLETPGCDAEVLLRWPLAEDVLPAAARDPARAFVAVLRREPGESVGAHAERLRAALAPLVERAYEHGAARVADLDALVAAASDTTRLSDVAADLTLEPPASTGELAGPPLIDEDWLVLSTVHSAKGLEWDVVHVLGATDGSFPADMALTTRDGLEEERRLFYVAVTRPRRALHVYVPLRYHHRPHARDDAHSFAQPSRFLSAGVVACFAEDRFGRDEALPTTVVDAGVRVDLALDALWA
ncbi:MAG: ATP-dependent helicase [Actinobacteria bacterium]|nr:ATP-dependent helicase [Actinomycetota bacterium]